MGLGVPLDENLLVPVGNQSRLYQQSPTGMDHSEHLIHRQKVHLQLRVDRTRGEKARLLVAVKLTKDNEVERKTYKITLCLL